jgi:hypothetical protein
MKHSLKALAILATMAATSAIAAPYSQNENFYVGGSGDLTWPRNADMGGGGNVAVGYRFNDVRVEGEIGYHAADNLHYITYMGNVYYDFNQFTKTHSGWRIVPYVGAGIGDAALHLGRNGSVSNTFHHNTDTFAYQGMAGVTLVSDSMPRVDWTLGYRYLNTDEDEIQASNIQAGVRYHF